MLDLSDTGVPLGTTGLIQRQNLLDTGVIRYMTYQIQNLSDIGLIRYKSTHRYYRTYSNTGVLIGTTKLNQLQEYP